ncbi:MAG: MBL fold metallo-hydrolase [Spirochaetes bacterium]|nr:MBL fold metallo-hydrolase [Spirochaetota bacterium]
MKVKLWGVRGSLPTTFAPTAIREKIKEVLRYATPKDISSEESIERFLDSLPFSLQRTYGGNTTCVELRTKNNDLIIIDGGTGLKHLGAEIMKEDFGKGKGVATMLFTHTHWDHIQGIPFFAPFYIKGNRFNIYSPFDDIKARIEYQQVFSHFPVNLDYMFATKEFYVLEKEAEFYLNDLKIFNKRMRHPGGCFGYRFEEDGKSFVFTSDCEFNIDEIDHIDSYADFFSNADVVVFDAQYTFEDSVINKVEWGHSSASIAIDISLRFGVKKLVLWHHDPDHSDKKMDTVLANAKAYLNMDKKRRSELEVDIAYEGMELHI